jgi:hypothetical protein
MDTRFRPVSAAVQSAPNTLSVPASAESFRDLDHAKEAFIARLSVVEGAERLSGCGNGQRIRSGLNGSGNGSEAGVHLDFLSVGWPRRVLRPGCLLDSVNGPVVTARSCPLNANHTAWAGSQAPL